MSTGYQSNIGYAGEPIQQSMLENPADYPNRNDTRFKLGVILTVYTADSQYNTSALTTAALRGYRHECTVQIFEDGIGNYTKINNVVIPPSVPSGVDNFFEVLPRGSSTSVDPTSVFDPNLQLMDPYNLDGDLCVVGFLGADRDFPFIVSWWPHPRNFVDPQTKGPGTSNTNTQGFVLDQSNRLFRRVNGNELVITNLGDIYLDTSTAGDKVVFGLPPVKGKTARTPSTTGGSFRGLIKQTASFELDWNVAQDGEGLAQSPDPQIPQSNPANTPQGNTFAPIQKASTFMKIDAAIFDLMVPTEIKLTSKSLISIESDSNCNILSPAITLGGRSTDFDIDANTTTITTADQYQNVAKSTQFDTTDLFSILSDQDVSITSTNNTTVDALNITATAQTEAHVKAPSVILGLGGGTELPLLTQIVADTWTESLPILVPPTSPPNPVSNAASIASIIAFINAINLGMQGGMTVETKAS